MKQRDNLINLKRLYEYGETFRIAIPRLTAFRWSAGHNRDDCEEQQDSQNDGLHDDSSVELTADGMLWQVTATEGVPITVRRKE
jgi:hypothetical protein